MPTIRAESDDTEKRLAALETEVTALKKRLDMLEKPNDPADPEAKLNPAWDAALAKANARRNGPGVRP